MCVHVDAASRHTGKETYLYRWKDERAGNTAMSIFRETNARSILKSSYFLRG